MQDLIGAEEQLRKMMGTLAKRTAQFLPSMASELDLSGEQLPGPLRSPWRRRSRRRRAR